MPGYWILTASDSPVSSAGVMDLAERCGRECPGVEPGEGVFRVASQLVANLLAQEARSASGCLEIQPFERIDDLVGQDVGKVGQGLAEFHRGAAKIAHRVNHGKRDAKVGFAQSPVALFDVHEPTAHTVDEIGAEDLRLKASQRPYPAEKAAGKRTPG